MCVPKAFHGRTKVLLACDRRPEKIEIENAQKEGGYSLTFKFRPGVIFQRLLVVPLYCC